MSTSKISVSKSEVWYTAGCKTNLRVHKVINRKKTSEIPISLKHLKSSLRKTKRHLLIDSASIIFINR